MPARKVSPILVLLAVFGSFAGCDKTEPSNGEPAAPVPPAVVPEEVRGTVAEHAAILGGGFQPVEGYCVVMGLGKNGSSEVPPLVEGYLIEYLRKQGLGWATEGTRDLTPRMILRDPDTAVVQVRGVIPPGAVRGDRFDLTVSALPQTQTKSLEGGMLMPTELRLSTGLRPAIGTGSKVLAMGGGGVFVNPFLDPEKSADVPKYRQGRVIGGGEVMEARKIRLQLYQPDYGMARRIERRVNERFGGLSQAAKGVNSQLIELAVPRAMADDVDRFTQLVMHLPLVASGAESDALAKRVTKMLQAPGARHEDLALIWEAMGRNVVPIVRELYASPNPETAFYAARTGLRLDDSAASDVLVRFTETTRSPYQLAAISELGRHAQVQRATNVLRKLTDDENELVRLEAYEALVRRGDRFVTMLDVDGSFRLDLVPSTRNYVIYATQTGRPRLVLFGGGVPVRRPVFYDSPDGMITVSAHEGDEKLMVFRRAPRTGQYSDTFHTGFTVAELVVTMGRRAERDVNDKVIGLGISYGQIVTALHKMCRDGMIPAKFVLQPPPAARTIPEGPSAVGRPD